MVEFITDDYLNDYKESPPESILEFIKENWSLLKNKRFGLLYSKLPYEDARYLSMVLYSCGINFLEYMDYIPVKAFWTTGVSTVVVPDNIVNIGDLAFGASTLTTITLPKRLKRLGRGAFGDCNFLRSVKMPKSYFVSKDLDNPAGEIANAFFPYTRIELEKIIELY